VGVENTESGRGEKKVNNVESPMSFFILLKKGGNSEIKKQAGRARGREGSEVFPSTAKKKRKKRPCRRNRELVPF